jgi:hypothetical protein
VDETDDRDRVTADLRQAHSHPKDDQGDNRSFFLGFFFLHFFWLQVPQWAASTGEVLPHHPDEKDDGSDGWIRHVHRSHDTSCPPELFSDTRWSRSVRASQTAQLCCTSLHGQCLYFLIFFLLFFIFISVFVFPSIRISSLRSRPTISSIYRSRSTTLFNPAECAKWQSSECTWQAKRFCRR